LANLSTLAAKNKSIKRGVKECVKAIRKVPSDIPPHSLANPRAVVIIAADISPPDVISHLPVLCENNNLPYVFVPSRVELGTYGNTKRPTSVVMIVRDLPKKNNNLTDEETKEHAELFKDLVKTAHKAGSA
jgi:H/ACA ribonucleoprotein complex subunit 2